MLAQNSVGDRLDKVAGIKPAEMRDLLGKLQASCREKNWQNFGEAVEYPLTVRSGGKRIRMVRSADLEKNAGRVLTEKVCGAVAAQKFDDLFVSARGAMIGKGEVWVSGVCKDKSCRESRLRVIAIHP